ncbi:uncharacterized protein LOC128718514 [Anopheles marshallii]|uniref:uncharacterized protein LOC128718514 n=1 Tax=Anopheles marshallii TaxID=1521116 RepID=UPI00237B99E5|nr:uncharacterized protein LOC128718514 [Anopheles marshallii]
MPYVLVETNDAVGSKELLAAPEGWIQRHDDGTVYLCWPNVRNINMLNALLTDEHSTPLATWETHTCVIKCSNIQSLSVAGKMIKTLQTHWKTSSAPKKRTIEANVDVTAGPVCKKSPINEDLEPDESQIILMFNELRGLIENRHDEARKKLHDGFYRIEKCLHSVGNELLSVEQEAVPDHAAQCFQSANAMEFYVNPVTCIDEMTDFEERLNDEEYQKQVQHWIDCAISHQTHPEHRMQEILDSLFDKQFLSNFSWTGRSTGKLAFMAYGNIVNLFAYAGTTTMHTATPRYVGQFFTKILQQTSAVAVRNHLSPELVTVDSTASWNAENNSILQTVERFGETTITEGGHSSQHSDDHANTEISIVNPLTCIEELDAFESKLGDAKYRAEMHTWVNDHVAYENNPEVRMIEILYLLFDKDFLSNFTWIGARKGRYGMRSYSNVVKLFQYVGTTAAHRADEVFVASFFNKKLRYASRRVELVLSDSDSDSRYFDMNE